MSRRQKSKDGWCVKPLLMMRTGSATWPETSPSVAGKLMPRATPAVIQAACSARRSQSDSRRSIIYFAPTEWVMLQRQYIEQQARNLPHLSNRARRRMILQDKRYSTLSAISRMTSQMRIHLGTFHLLSRIISRFATQSCGPCKAAAPYRHINCSECSMLMSLRNQRCWKRYTLFPESVKSSMSWRDCCIKNWRRFNATLKIWSWAAEW